MTTQQLYKSGQLQDALAAARQEVKSKPNDVSARWFLCELLCFEGDLERADGQLDAITAIDPQAVLTVSLFRQLVRAEQSRREVFDDGRVPEFLSEDVADLKLRLQAALLLREGRAGEAGERLTQADDQRPRVSGLCDGAPFNDLRDLDDVTASFFEVLTSTGKYYWVPFANIELVEFHGAQRARDLLWRPAHMIVRGGPDGEVFVAATYPGSHASEDDAIRLGRATDWLQAGDGVVRGAGQRMLLIGDENDRSLMEITTLTFDERAQP